MERYVPELAGCGYRGARVTDLLDMRSGIRFLEDYLDPDCEMGWLDRASGWKPIRQGDPESVYDLVLRLRQDRPHGGRFKYRSIETDVLGWMLERSTGRHLCTIMEETLWGPMGPRPTLLTRSTVPALRSAMVGSTPLCATTLASGC